MKKLVNINGQQLEIEQCVLDNDELDDNTISICGDTMMYPDGTIVDIQENEEFIKEYIEKDLDSQPENIEEWEYLQNIQNQELEVLPSCLDCNTWLSKRRNEELSKEDNRLIDLEILLENIQSEIDEITEGFRQEYVNIYLRNYRKELREWWFKRKEKLNGEQVS